MKRGSRGSSPSASRSWLIVTLRTASTTCASGQTASSSASLLTIWRGRSTRYSSIRNALADSSTRRSPRQRHWFGRSRRGGRAGLGGIGGPQYGRAAPVESIQEAVGTNHLALLHVLELHWSSIGTPEMALPYPRLISTKGGVPNENV